MVDADHGRSVAFQHEIENETFRELVRRYSDVSLFSIVRLERLRLGLGHVCMRYAVEPKGEGEVVQGGTHLRWRIKDTEVAGAKRRVLSIELPTGLDDVVEVLADGSGVTPVAGGSLLLIASAGYTGTALG